MASVRFETKRALLLGTILTGAMASSTEVWASQATGCTPAAQASSGAITCTAAGNTYTNGILYIPTADTHLTIESGVLVTGPNGISNAGIGVGRAPPNAFPAADITIDNAGTVNLLSASLVAIGAGVQDSHSLVVNNTGDLTGGSGIYALAEPTVAGTGDGHIAVTNSATMAVLDGIVATAGGTNPYRTADVTVRNGGLLDGRTPAYFLEHGIEASAYTDLTGTGSVSITNTGTIRAIETGVLLHGSGAIFNATIQNEGTIAASTTGASAIGADPSSAGGLIHLVNTASGVISADGRYGVGVAISSNRLSQSGAFVSASSADVTVDNAGQISVTGDADSPQRSAAVVMSSGGTGTVNNSGTISATNARVALGLAPQSLVESLQTSTAAATTSTERSVLNNSGTIRNATLVAVQTGDQPTTITNSGTISAERAVGVAIGFGAGANVLAITPGSSLIGRVINGTDPRTAVTGDSGARGTVTVSASNRLVLAGSGSESFDLTQLADTPAQQGYTPVNGGTQYATTAYVEDVTHQFQGFSLLDKQGDSTWTLTGATTFAGPTTVSAGRLQVDGSLSRSAVTVAGGAQLGGSGTVGGLTVLDGGSVAQASGTPLSTLHVAGNLTFAAGSTYQVRIQPDGLADTLEATGAATINGGTVGVLGGSGTYTTGTTYTIITAAGGRTGTFDKLTVASDLAFLTPELTYDATHVTLLLGRKTTGDGGSTGGGATGGGSTGGGSAGGGSGSGGSGTGGSGTGGGSGSSGGPAVVTFPMVAATANQRATAAALETLGPGNPLYDAVLSQSVAGAQQAFAAASGEVHASAVTAGIEGARLSRDAIFDRLDDAAREGAPAALGAVGSFGGLAPALPPGAQGYATVHKGYDAPIATAAAAPPAPAFAAWGAGFGDFGRVGGNGNAAALDRSMGGFVLGLDTRLDWKGLANWHIGVAGGYTSDTLKVAGRASSGTFETYFGGLYAGAQYGAIAIKLGVLGGGTSTDTRRTVAFPLFLDQTRASYGGSIVQGFGELGYKIGFGNGFIEPLVQGAAIHLSQDGFRERGGAASLIGFARDTDVETTTLGIRAEAALPVLGLPLVARGFLGWRHAFGDVDPRTLLAFAAGSPSFSIAGAPIDRDALVAQAGLDYRASRNLTVGVSYDGQAGNRAYDNAVKGRVEVRF